MRSSQALTLGTFRNRKQDAGHKGLAVMRLLEHHDLLAEARAVAYQGPLLIFCIRSWELRTGGGASS